MVALAILANAVVCGALSNPNDRYGARMVWLATLVVLLVPWMRRRAPTAIRLSAREFGPSTANRAVVRRPSQYRRFSPISARLLAKCVT